MLHILELAPSISIQAAHRFYPVRRLSNNFHSYQLPILVSVSQAKILPMETDNSMVVSDDIGFLV